MRRQQKRCMPLLKLNFLGVLWIRICFHACGFGSSSGTGILMTKICTFYGSKISYFLYEKLQSLCFHDRQTSSKKSLQPSKENIQHLHPKIEISSLFLFCFWGSFFFSWFRIRIQSAKPNADPCGSGSKALPLRILLFNKQK